MRQLQRNLGRGCGTGLLLACCAIGTLDAQVPFDGERWEIDANST